MSAAATSMPPLSGRLAIILGFLLGTWTLLDGLHRFITGDYVRWHGQLGPWAGLVTKVGLNPMALGGVFVALGVLWLVGANLYLYQNSRPTWRGMVALVVLSGWYLGPATPMLVAQIPLLLWARSRCRA